MWVFQVKNVKLQATTKLFIVAIFYQINPTQNTTNITEITKNSLNSVPHTNLKIGEKFSLIVFIAIQHNLTLLTFFSYCCKFLTGTRIQSEQLIAQKSAIVKRKDVVSVTNTRHSFILHTIVTGVNCIIRSISQSKEEFNSSKQLVVLAIKGRIYEIFIKIEKKHKKNKNTHNGLFFSHKKQCFN